MCIWFIAWFTLYSHETSSATVSNPLHISQIYKCGWVRTFTSIFASVCSDLICTLSLPADSCGLHFLCNRLIFQPKFLHRARRLLCSPPVCVPCLPLSGCLWGRNTTFTTSSASQHFPSCPCHNKWVLILLSLTFSVYFGHGSQLERVKLSQQQKEKGMKARQLQSINRKRQ